MKETLLEPLTSRRAEWEAAHTDHTRPPARPGPAGLARSVSDWRTELEHQAPNGWLLRDNAMTQMLASGGPIHLMHTTVALSAIRSSGQLYASTGCLVASLYCAPLTAVAGGLRPHNLGAYLLETKPHTDVLVFQIDPGAPIPPKGVDYLRLGKIHLRTYQAHRSFLTETEDTTLRAAALAQITRTAPFLDLALATATGRPTRPETFLDQLAGSVPLFPFLGYLYFETVAEYLMLHSVSASTKAYAQAGELNNRLYKTLAFQAVPSMAKLFDLSLFDPSHHQLLDLVTNIEPGLAADAAAYVTDRLSHLLAVISLAEGQDAAAATFTGGDFDSLAAIAPGLVGQAVYRVMRIIDRYPQLYLALEEAKALEAWDYWNTQGIVTPFNGFLPKGEIGVNPAYPHATITVWAAETCQRGLLHPTKQLPVVLWPRLAELRLTAMRRDDTGKAAGHRQPTEAPPSP